MTRVPMYWLLFQTGIQIALGTEAPASTGAPTSSVTPTSPAPPTSGGPPTTAATVTTFAAQSSYSGTSQSESVLTSRPVEEIAHVFRRYCANDLPIVLFGRKTGRKAYETFCKGLAGKEPTPWRKEIGPVRLTKDIPSFATGYHWGPGEFFDLRVDRPEPSTSGEYTFQEQALLDDCMTAFANLSTFCKLAGICVYSYSPDTGCDGEECQGGSIRSALEFRYTMNRRRSEIDNPPQWVHAERCIRSNNTDDLSKRESMAAIDHFCKAGLKLPTPEGGYSTNQKAVAEFEKHYQDYEIQVDLVPSINATWDGSEMCRKGLDIAENPSLCTAPLSYIINQCSSFGRASWHKSGAIYHACGYWILKRKGLQLP